MINKLLSFALSVSFLSLIGISQEANASISCESTSTNNSSQVKVNIGGDNSSHQLARIFVKIHAAPNAKRIEMFVHQVLTKSINITAFSGLEPQKLSLVIYRELGPTQNPNLYYRGFLNVGTPGSNFYVDGLEVQCHFTEEPIKTFQSLPAGQPTFKSNAIQEGCCRPGHPSMCC